MKKVNEYKPTSPLEFLGEVAQNFASEAKSLFFNSLELLYIVYYCIVKLDKSIFLCFSPTITVLSTFFSIFILMIECFVDCFCCAQFEQTIASKTIKLKGKDNA
jgi:hypothetical protein